MDSDTAVSDPPTDVAPPINAIELLLGSRTHGTKQIGPRHLTVSERGRVPKQGGRAPGPARHTIAAAKLRHEMLLVASGEMPKSKASPRVRGFYDVLDKAQKDALKGKARREYREQFGDVLGLLPKEDTLTIRAETIMVGPGADEAADEALAEGE